MRILLFGIALLSVAAFAKVPCPPVLATEGDIALIQSTAQVSDRTAALRALYTRNLSTIPTENHSDYVLLFVDAASSWGNYEYLARHNGTVSYTVEYFEWLHRQALRLMLNDTQIADLQLTMLARAGQFSTIDDIRRVYALLCEHWRRLGWFEAAPVLSYPLSLVRQAIVRDIARFPKVSDRYYALDALFAASNVKPQQFHDLATDSLQVLRKNSGNTVAETEYYYYWVGQLRKHSRRIPFEEGHLRTIKGEVLAFAKDHVGVVSVEGDYGPYNIDYRDYAIAEVTTKRWGK